MTSIDIVTAKETVKQYLKGLGMPGELQRMIVKEIYDEVRGEALQEIQRELEKGEKDGEKE